MQQKHKVKPYSLCTVQVLWGSRLWVFKFLWSHSHFCTRVELFSVLSWIYICCGVTILDWRIQCWVCVSARLLPKCPWHQNREEEDRWDNLPGGPPTNRAPCCARCLHQSVTQHHKSLPQHLIVLCHPQCVTCAVWVCRSHDGLSNWLRFTRCVFSFLMNRIKNDIPHTKQASSRDASFSQPVLFSIGLATAPGFWSVSCLTSRPRQKGKAVITNELLLMKLSLTMQLDQCVAP